MMKEVFTLVVLLSVLGFMLLAIHIVAKRKGYKQGQIDALTGKVIYELKAQPDSSKVWIEKGE